MNACLTGDWAEDLSEDSHNNSSISIPISLLLMNNDIHFFNDVDNSSNQ